jgi:hypothetical protein
VHLIGGAGCTHNHVESVVASDVLSENKPQQLKELQHEHDADLAFKEQFLSMVFQCRSCAD